MVFATHEQHDRREQRPRVPVAEVENQKEDEGLRLVVDEAHHLVGLERGEQAECGGDAEDDGPPPRVGLVHIPDYRPALCDRQDGKQRSVRPVTVTRTGHASSRHGDMRFGTSGMSFRPSEEEN